MESGNKLGTLAAITQSISYCLHEIKIRSPLYLIMDKLTILYKKQGFKTTSEDYDSKTCDI